MMARVWGIANAHFDRTIMMPMIMMVAMTLLLMPVLAAANTWQPQTKTELQNAVNAYTSSGTLPNNTAIADWDTSLMTDMSNLFNGKSTFNADISQWNTSSVTSMHVSLAFCPFLYFICLCVF